jgi:hypothetical protein
VVGEEGGGARRPYIQVVVWRQTKGGNKALLSTRRPWRGCQAQSGSNFWPPASCRTAVKAQGSPCRLLAAPMSVQLLPQGSSPAMVAAQCKDPEGGWAPHGRGRQPGTGPFAQST